MWVEHATIEHTTITRFICQNCGSKRCDISLSPLKFINYICPTLFSSFLDIFNYFILSVYAEVARYYKLANLVHFNCNWHLRELANSGLDLEEVAQEFSKLKPPNIRPENRSFTIIVLRFIYYDVSSLLSLSLSPPIVCSKYYVFLFLFLAIMI